MFIESREKLRRRVRVKARPRSFELEKRWKNEKMSYEMRVKLLKMERKLPVVKVYDKDDYFPEEQVATWFRKIADFLVNAFFTFVTVILIIALLMSMGPSRMMVECLVDPMTIMFDPYVVDGDYAQLQKCARTALVNDIFGLG